MQRILRKISQPVESMHETNAGCIIQLCLNRCPICVGPLEGQHALIWQAHSVPCLPRLGMHAKNGDACRDWGCMLRLGTHAKAGDACFSSLKHNKLPSMTSHIYMHVAELEAVYDKQLICS